MLGEGEVWKDKEIRLERHKLGKEKCKIFRKD